MENQGWLGRAIITTVIGGIFSAATIFAISYLNTINTNVSTLSTAVNTIQTSIGKSEAELKQIEILRALVTQTDNKDKEERKELTKIISECEKKCVALEEKIKSLEKTKPESQDHSVKDN